MYFINRNKYHICNFRNLYSFKFPLLIENKLKILLKNSLIKMFNIGDCEKYLILDLTENYLTGTDLRFLSEFTNLKTLILDKNQIESKFLAPYMPHLETLWVNHNKIENLSVFIQHLTESCPNLKYLSMLNNKAAPSYFNGGSLVEYNEYRLYVISKLIKLQMLDHKEIAAEERIQSQTIYGALLKKKSIRKKSTLKRFSSEESNKKTFQSTKETQSSENTDEPLNILPNLENINNEQKTVKPPPFPPPFEFI
jgi:hypothetical protein